MASVKEEMENKVKRFVIVLGILCLSLRGYSQSNPLQEVLASIRNNRVQDISRYFDSFVPITINNSPSNYSHNQAELVLRDFFDKNPPREFVVTDNGTTGNNSLFAIATFKSNSGKYSLYMLMKQKEGTYVVKEIRLTRE